MVPLSSASRRAAEREDRIEYGADRGRGRGRPPILRLGDDIAGPPLPSAPLTPIDRRQFDYSDLDHWMAQMDQAIRRTGRVLGDMARPMMTGSATHQPVDDDHAPSGYADAEAMP